MSGGMNAMRWVIPVLVGASLLGAPGCSKTKSGGTPPPAKKAATTNEKKSKKKSNQSGKAEPKVIVTPASGLSGKVASVNVPGQFVVVTFQGGALPSPDQKLSVYRNGLKVGEIKVSKEQIGRNVVADLVAGEAKVEDDVRPD